MYLLRFGVKKVETIDITNYLHNDLKHKWLELNFPIIYTIIPNDSCLKTNM